MRRIVRADRLTGLADPAAGLTAAQAAARLAQFGPNAIVPAERAGWRDLLRDTVRDPMIWFLVAVGALMLAIGETRDGAILIAAILPLVGMDFVLHRRTRASTAGLSSRLATEATVLRDGRTASVPSTVVVPGDLALVGSGAAFPADGLIVDGSGLQVDESALTGESFPVHKRPVDLARGALRGGIDAAGWGFAGTRVLTGTARLLVVDTGADTVYGEIVRSAVQGRHERTPLQRQIGQLVGVLLVAALVLCLALAWVRLEQGFGPVDAALSALTLAVAAIPEEFPIVFTVFLGVGVYRLARRQALVRRAVVVENIGRVSCICTDKTGTLTEGRLTLAHSFPAPGGHASALLEIAALASRADNADPLDAAILRAADTPRGDEALACYPFTEDRRRETAIVRRDDGLLAATKGAPETVLALCALDEAARDRWRDQVDALAATGHKVIACASRALAAAGWPGGEPDRGFAFAGLLAFEDPLREGVAAAVADARAAAIRVVMVTGDHPATAGAIARELGLGGGQPHVVDGAQLDALLAGDGEALTRVDAVARAVPSQKLALVRALQARGEIVAVTGDGVNDVPALQAADIGIAMGERGTRSARDVGAIVLMDDNFRTIVRAIAEGRQLFQNLRLSFAYLLIFHLPFVLAAAVVPLAGEPLLYLPIHIVWIELIVHPTALLVFQGAAPRGPLAVLRRDGSRRFFTRGEWTVIAGTGGLITLAMLGSYQYGLPSGAEHARSVALVLLAVASAALTLLLARARGATAWAVAGAAFASAVLLVQVPAAADALHLTPLHLADWLLAAGGAVVAALPATLLGIAGR
ncbi:MAG: cation-transporting P-type ATPase [Alphaproteobacteria bacterium]